MITYDDDSSLVRTLTREEIACLADNLRFNWCVILDDLAQSQVRRTVRDATDSIELGSIPAVAIVHRPTISSDDHDVEVDVYDGLGKRLCTLEMTGNGLGNMRLLTLGVS